MSSLVGQVALLWAGGLLVTVASCFVYGIASELHKEREENRKKEKEKRCARLQKVMSDRVKKERDKSVTDVAVEAFYRGELSLDELLSVIDS